MLLSIYIVNYNYTSYLSICLKSVLDYLPENVEVIFIDDCSEDFDFSLLTNFRNRIRHIVINDDNLGLIRCSNIALKMCSGEFVMRLDADDYLVENFYDLVLPILKNNYESDILYGNYYLFNNFNSEIQSFVHRSASNRDLPFHGACTLIRRSLLLKIGLYDESFNRQDGYYLWLNALIQKVKISLINDFLFYYRKHTRSLSANRSSLLKSRREIKKKVLSDFQNFHGEVYFLLEDDSILEQRMSVVKKFIAAFPNLNYLIFTDESSEKLVRDTFCVPVFSKPNMLSTYSGHLLELIQRFSTGDFLLIEPDYPFITVDSLLEVVITSNFFNYDCCLTVYLDTNTYLWHEGERLSWLNISNVNRSERQDLFKVCGGLKYFKSINYYQSYLNKIDLSIGHVEIDFNSSIRFNDISL